MSTGSVIDAWLNFLKYNVEPHAGKVVVRDLALALDGLPADSRWAWLNGFIVTVGEYVKWANETLIFIDRLSEEWTDFSPVSSDIREVIAPHESWTSVIR